MTAAEDLDNGWAVPRESIGAAGAANGTSTSSLPLTGDWRGYDDYLGGTGLTLSFTARIEDDGTHDLLISRSLVRIQQGSPYSLSRTGFRPWGCHPRPTNTGRRMQCWSPRRDLYLDRARSHSRNRIIMRA